MKHNALKMALIAVLGVTSLTGCMGQMAATGLVNKFNLEVVDNRYAREGLFLLLSPVYGLTSTADLFILTRLSSGQVKTQFQESRQRLLIFLPKRLSKSMVNWIAL